jgi:hypothetical protein
MEKILKEKIIFSDAQINQIKWKDIKHIEFEDDDIIICCYVEPFITSNEECPEHYAIHITRMVEETDDEYEARMNALKKNKETAKKLRYNTYLKLKDEFKNE